MLYKEKAQLFSYKYPEQKEIYIYIHVLHQSKYHPLGTVFLQNMFCGTLSKKKKSVTLVCHPPPPPFLGLLVQLAL